MCALSADGKGRRISSHSNSSKAVMNKSLLSRMSKHRIRHTKEFSFVEVIANGYTHCLCSEVFFFVLFCFFVFLPFLGPHPWHMKAPRLGVQLELKPQATTYTTALGNAGSPTHWARSGIEPETSWFLVGFVNHWATMGTPCALCFCLNLSLRLFNIADSTLGSQFLKEFVSVSVELSYNKLSLAAMQKQHTVKKLC